MSGYFDEVDHKRMLAEYPIGAAFLDGPAKLSADALRALQERRFAAVMKRAWEVPFYARRWKAAGLEAGDVRSLDDLAKIPPFSKTDLMRSVEEHPPFGDYHGRIGSAAHLSVVFHTTSGTTGTPQPLFFGAWDREMQNAMLARAYLLQGLRDDDVVHSVYGFGMVNGGHYIRETILHFTKAILMPAGTGLETRSEQQVELMRHFGATVIVGFIDYIQKLAQVARDKGVIPGRDIRIRMITGHIGQEDREAIREAWGGPAIFDWYGVGDTGTIAAETPEGDGLCVWEDAHLLEVLDPDTLAPLPDGERGNLCTTVLFKTGIYPIVRFNTNDVSSFIPGARGQGGVNFRRITGFQGRSDNMVKLRGVNVYPTAIGAHLREHPAATGEYVCLVERSGLREEMTVVVEARDRSAAVADEFRALLRRRLGVDVAVELVGPGETAPLTEIDRRQKPIRLIDRRKG
jgi:phenylacetate-CoA ligase